MNGDILWTQQRCSGIRYERKNKKEGVGKTVKLIPNLQRKMVENIH